MPTTGENRPKLLVADDEKAIATTLHSIFEREGYCVALAFDGETAVSLARDFKPQVLVTDIQMPRLNGVEAALKIVHELPNCSVFLYSGYRQDSALVNTARAKGFQFIQKPVAPEELLNTIRGAVHKNRPTSYQAVVLNVDDNEMQRYAVTRLLKRAGFVVKEAASGEEALALARTKPDLIVLDIKLPDIDGFEVCRRLKTATETAHIPVVHLTNIYKDEAARRASAEAGAEHYLTHPIEVEELMSTLRGLVGKAIKARPE